MEAQMYKMVARYTVTLEAQNPQTGEAVKTLLIAKNVEREQVECELDGRVAYGVVKMVMDNMDASVAKIGEAFSVFPHLDKDNFVFYVVGYERMG